MRIKPFKKGFTLIEVLIASTLLVVALCGLLGAYVLCYNLIETARNTTLATNAVQLKLEEIRDHNFYDIEADYDSTSFTVIGFSAQNARGAIAVQPVTSDLLRVTVSVSWRQRGNRIIGEDNGRGVGGVALDGQMNGTEDVNGNGVLDSPVMVETVVTKR